MNFYLYKKAYFIRSIYIDLILKIILKIHLYVLTNNKNIKENLLIDNNVKR